MICVMSGYPFNLLTIAFGLLGLAVGSFLNVCMDRLPSGQSIIRLPSHCPSCNQRLRFVDLVPVLSYVWLRGRCRYCYTRIPLRLPLVEMAMGILFALLYLVFGLTVELGIIFVYASLLGIIFITDLEHQLVLDKVTFPGMAIAFIFSFFWPGLSPLRALLGGAVGLAAIALPFVVYRKGMGMGDIKLGALVGLMTGFPAVLVALLLSVISGALVSVFLLIIGLKKRQDSLPFATFITASTMVALLRGEMLWHWYLRLLDSWPFS